MIILDADQKYYGLSGTSKKLNGREVVHEVLHDHEKIKLNKSYFRITC